MQNFPRFGSWFIKALGGLLAGGLIFYYGVLHLGVGIPLHQISTLWLLHSGLGVVVAPLLYWSLKHQSLSGGDWKPFFVIVGACVLVGCLLLFYYASKLGFIPLNEVGGYYLTVVIIIAPATVGGYYLSRKLFPHLYKRSDSGMGQQ